MISYPKFIPIVTTKMKSGMSIDEIYKYLKSRKCTNEECEYIINRTISNINAEARKECEDKILSLMQEIVKVYHEYRPGGNYLSLAFVDGVMQCNNRNWPGGEDANSPIDFHCYKGMKNDY